MKVIEALMIIFLWAAMHGKNQEMEPQTEAETAVLQKTCGEMLQMAVCQSEMEVRREGETEKESETKKGSETERWSAADKGRKTEGGSETEKESETERGNETEKESETEAKSGEERECETEAESAGGDQNGRESEMESEADGMTESETETQRESRETESESGTESESESGKKQIVITVLYAGEDGVKTYDGTTDVKVTYIAEGVPESMELNVTGSIPSADVGEWPVQCQAALTGEESEEYELIFDMDCIKIQVQPKPLTIEISDGRKYYYAENEMENVRFLEDETEYIHVSGFVEAGQPVETAPEGFEKPELMIAEESLNRSSPMFRDGRPIEYAHALVVKKDELGNVTGNPTENYCFVAEDDSEYYKPGSIVLEAPPITGILDYVMRGEEPFGVYTDDNGVMWLKEGMRLYITPQKGRGFTDGAVLGPFHMAGTAEFELKRYSSGGELLARSKKQRVKFSVDGNGPEGQLVINGNQREGEEELFCAGEVLAEVVSAADKQSGLKSVHMLAYREGDFEGVGQQEIYRQHSERWGEQRELLLTGEGSYRVLARLEDRVGNVRYLESKTIIIDKSIPELMIAGVKPGSANNGKLSLRIECRDSYYREGSLQMTLKGKRHGSRRLPVSRRTEEEGEVIVTDDFPRERSWDDLYMLQIRAEDMAGNIAEKSMIFSVNRFGSVYLADSSVMEKIRGFYLREAIPMTIREINVDRVVESRILLGHDGVLRTLRRGKDYRVSSVNRGDHWKEYLYEIFSSNFQEEGVYYLILSSRDRAENVSDNRLQNLKLEFAVDKTGPSILITGVEDGEQYPEEERTVIVQCRDNISLERLSLWLNDKPVSVESPEYFQMTIKADKEWQKIRAEASDSAGNITTGKEIRFQVAGDEPSRRKEEAEVSSTEKNMAEEEKDDLSASESGREAVLGKRPDLNEGDDSYRTAGVMIAAIVISAALCIRKRKLFYKR